MDEIPRTLKVTRIHPIKLPSKMLLRSQHLKPNGLEPRDQKLDFNGESSDS